MVMVTLLHEYCMMNDDDTGSRIESDLMKELFDLMLDRSDAESKLEFRISNQLDLQQLKLKLQHITQFAIACPRNRLHPHLNRRVVGQC